MNRGKEPLASLCERKFVLDAIKENKVSPHYKEPKLIRGLPSTVLFSCSLVNSAAGRSRGVRLPLPPHLSQYPPAGQRRGHPGKDQVRNQSQLGAGHKRHVPRCTFLCVYVRDKCPTNNIFALTINVIYLCTTHFLYCIRPHLRSSLL